MKQSLSTQKHANKYSVVSLFPYLKYKSISGFPIGVAAFGHYFYSFFYSHKTGAHSFIPAECRGFIL